MARSSDSGSRRGEGPRRAGKWDSRPSPRSAGGPPARRGDERAPRGGAARSTPSRPGPRSVASSAARPGSRPAPRSDARPAPRPADPDKLLARQPWAALRAHIPGTAGEVEARLAALRGYAKQLLEWNRGVSNLVSRHDEPRIVERHLIESVSPARLLAGFSPKRFVDFGSGAGLPAVPLALCGIGEHWTLIESRRNKTLFLRKIQQDNGFRNFDVRTGRLEVLVDEDTAGLSCDAFTSRATAALGPTLELAARIVETGGHAFLWKGSSYEQEMADGRRAWETAWRLDSVQPIGGGPNVIVVMERL